MEDPPLGTAGAFKKAQNMIDETTVVFNGDVLTDLDLSKVIAFHKQREADATIVLTPVRNPSAYGLVEYDQEQHVVRFLEKPTEEEITSNTINAGVYILEPTVLDFIPVGQYCSFEREVFPRLLEAGKKFFACMLDGFWLDIGTPQKYLEANFRVLSGRFALPDFPSLYRAKNYQMEGKVFIDDSSLLDENCHLHPGVQIRNSAVGPNCHIGKNANVENAVIWSATRIESEATITGCIIGKGCYIGSFTRIGRGHVLADKSTIGDYSFLEDAL
jgi:NDP-sugar pyrophosphorylase family protein